MNYVNKSFSLMDLAEINGTKAALKEWQRTWDFLSSKRPKEVANGRINHAFISPMIEEISGGIFTPGGQGTASPDLWYNGKRVEQKAFQKGSSECWTAASRFFASNSGTKRLKQFIGTNPSSGDMKQWMIDESYCRDDLYLLTSTSKWNGIVKDVELIMVEKEIIQDCLLREHLKNKPYCFTDLCKLRGEKISKLL